MVTVLVHAAAQRLGGPVKAELLAEAKKALCAHLSEGLARSGVDEELPLATMCEHAVETFKLHMNERQKQMLAKIGGADYAVDLQNCILAFAGRVLLRQVRCCSLSFALDRRDRSAPCVAR